MGACLICWRNSLPSTVAFHWVTHVTDETEGGIDSGEMDISILPIMVTTSHWVAHVMVDPSNGREEMGINEALIERFS